jgi:hypothetical protein
VLRANHDVVLAAVAQNGLALAYADPSLRSRQVSCFSAA